MHRPLVVRREQVAHRRAVCRGCGHGIVCVAAVGWFDPGLGRSYDICPRDRYGNHAADPATVVRVARNRPTRPAAP